MLVSIVTVLSRLPSLAATMEAKFSAPAESKATVKKKEKEKNINKNDPPPSPSTSTNPSPPPSRLHLFGPRWCHVMICGSRQLISASVRPSFFFLLAMLFFVCLVIHSISASSCMMMHCTLHSHLVFISSPSSSLHVVGLILCFCPHAASVSRTVVSFCVVKDLHWSHWSHWSIIPSCPSSCTGPL